MNLSEASKIRFNGVDVKMVKLNGDVVYRKKEEDPLLIAQYTASESGVIPTFNAGFTGYNVGETIVDGVYSVTIRTDTADNTPTSILFSGMKNLLTVGYLKIDNVTNMRDMFLNCNALTSLDVSGWDTSNVTNMFGTFQNCSALTSLDSMMNISTDLYLPPSLNEESILDVFDNLASVSSRKTLAISKAQLSWVPDDKIIEANNKGWSISA